MATKTAYRIAPETQAAQRPDWLDENLYPFQSHYIEIEGNRIHYIDEGTGPVLLFIHGVPAWSFLYRNIIRGLRDRFRCIALDWPGFGLSTAAPGFHNTLLGNSRLLERFIQTLGLTDITLMVHDSGGAMGLGVVGRYPEKFRALIISNAFGWSMQEHDPGIYRFIKLVASGFFRFLIVNFDFLTGYFARSVNHGKLTPAERRAYRGPTRRRSARRHQHDIFKSITRSHDYLVDLEQRLLPLKNMPVLLTFADGDPTYKAGWLARYEGMFPRHRSVIIKGADHFPQECGPDQIVTAIRNWWESEMV